MIDCNITTNYFSERRRLCDSYVRCSEGCPLCKEDSDGCMKCLYMNEDFTRFDTIAIVQKWSNENPKKTYLAELLESAC